jgi:hypothetical protein
MENTQTISLYWDYTKEPSSDLIILTDLVDAIESACIQIIGDGRLYVVIDKGTIQFSLSEFADVILGSFIRFQIPTLVKIDNNNYFISPEEIASYEAEKSISIQFAGYLSCSFNCFFVEDHSNISNYSYPLLCIGFSFSYPDQRKLQDFSLF